MSVAASVLVVVVAYAIVAFGWRSFRLWRRTGSTGFRGISGRVGSAEWLGGVLLAVAFVLAAAAPLAVVCGALAPVALPSAAFVAGGVLLGLGVVGTVAAQLSMGDSWRVGVDPAERTALVSRGLFRLARNPVFTSMLFVLAGLVLLVPTPLSVVAFVAAFVGIELQVRLVEEPYLQKTHGDAYADYAARVGRFLPLFGRRRGR